MNAATIKAGAIAGAIGGMVMAMFAMVALWLTDVGFWAPLNLIAHTAWSDAPLDGEFSGGAVAIGLVIHMAISMMLGAAIAVVLSKMPKLNSSTVVAAITGMVIGLVAWVLVQYVAWPAIDQEAADAFTPWVFGAAHAMFGVVTGALASRSLAKS